MRALFIPLALTAAIATSTGAMAATNYNTTALPAAKTAAAKTVANKQAMPEAAKPARMASHNHHYRTNRLTARLEHLKDQIQSAHKSGELSKSEYTQVMHDYRQVRHNIHAASSDSQMKPQAYWNLNGQLNYLDKQITKFSSNAAKA